MLDEDSVDADGLPIAPAEFRRIVVAVGEDGALAALQLAQELAAGDAVFVLVHIQAEGPIVGALPTHVHSRDSTPESMDLLLAARAALGLPCEIVVEAARSVADGLRTVAEREQADLLVIEAGVPAADGGAGGAMISAWTLHAVLHGAPCAVAIAPGTPAARATGRIGIGYRPTDPGRHAFAVARRLAASRSAELHAITVVPVVPSALIGRAAGTAHGVAQLSGVLAEVAQGDLLELAGTAGHVIDGDPVLELERFSHTVDLLVVGTRSAGPLRRIVSGSTSDALSARAHCPLLVVGTGDGPSRDVRVH